MLLLSLMLTTEKLQELRCVKFYNKDGEVIRTRYLFDGMNAEAPEAPLENGYRFIKWDKDFTRT